MRATKLRVFEKDFTMPITYKTMWHNLASPFSLISNMLSFLNIEALMRLTLKMDELVAKEKRRKDGHARASRILC